jgi:hypothetical protein
MRAKDSSRRPEWEQEPLTSGCSDGAASDYLCDTWLLWASVFAAVRQGRGLGYLLDFSSMIEASWGILSEGQISIAWG